MADECTHPADCGYAGCACHERRHAEALAALTSRAEAAEKGRDDALAVARRGWPHARKVAVDLALREVVSLCAQLELEDEGGLGRAFGLVSARLVARIHTTASVAHCPSQVLAESVRAIADIRRAAGERLRADGPWHCDQCGHEHRGGSLANICIGCACPFTAPQAAPAGENAMEVDHAE